jgi:DUF4097 and DUF4098 domain-containing protein YvlB
VRIHRSHLLGVAVLALGSALAGCGGGPTVGGAFDRSFTVTGHTRLEISSAAGNVDVSASSDGQVHVHGEVHARGKQRLDETLANPSVEQREDTIRIGKRISNLRNVSIDYKIEVPRDTEVNATVVSGTQTIREVRGPVTSQGASGSMRVEHVERDVQMTTMSGAVEATDIGDDVRASSASGEITIRNATGDVRGHSLSGAVHVFHPGGRIEAESASGGIEIQGAKFDVKAHGVSGELKIHGDPGEHGFWDLKTVSGAVQVAVPANANFRFSSEATSGNIRTDIPIVVEEQGKHSLRAHVGNGGGRIEVRTVSGEIHISGSN